MRELRHVVAWASAACVAWALAGSVQARPARSSVDVPVTKGVPQFRDPKTGQVWTQLNVGGKSGPPTPQDLAFDPLQQAAHVRGVITQRPPVVPLDSVPITAGPTVPIVNLGGAILSAIPGRRWEVALYLDNNSAAPVLPVIHCRFTNVGRLVEQTHVLVPRIGAGVRVGMIIYGPKTDLFVDRANCAVTSP